MRTTQPHNPDTQIAESIHYGVMTLDVDGRILHSNSAGLRLFGQADASQLTHRSFADLFDPRDVATVRDAIATARSAGCPPIEVSFRSPTGIKRWWDISLSPILSADDSVTGFLVICRDITARIRREEFRSHEHRMIEMIASGKPLEKALEGIVLLIEEYSEGAHCCVLLLGEDRKTVQEMCAPSFSDEYNRAVFGLPVGPRVGSCGTAMYREEKVIIKDIYNDPLWEGFDEIKRLSGGRGCWSTPIFSDDNEVVGSFAIYAREARLPTDEEVGLMDTAASFARLALDKHRAQQGRRRAEEAVSTLAGRLIHAQEEAQRRFAAELHDDLSQRLALLSVEFEMFGLNPSSTAPEITARMQAFSDRVRTVSSEIHRLSHALHPSNLSQLGLETALHAFCRELSRTQSLDISFIARNLPKSIQDAPALCLYRIAQEALHNVVKHSKASWAEVVLEPQDSLITLTVTDNGIGYHPDAATASGSLGIVSMNERARFIGGKITFSSPPDGGTRIKVKVPSETTS